MSRSTGLLVFALLALSALAGCENVDGTPPLVRYATACAGPQAPASIQCLGADEMVVEPVVPAAVICTWYCAEYLQAVTRTDLRFEVDGSGNGCLKMVEAVQTECGGAGGLAP